MLYTGYPQGLSTGYPQVLGGVGYVRIVLTMNERDNWTCDAMERYGGSFVKTLALLARQADPLNLSKIKDTWIGYWKEYEIQGMKMQSEE